METKRMDINEVTPGAYQSLLELNAFLRQSSLSTKDQDLIKVRASIINGCAFCIQTHIKDALENGETTKRIFALNAWEESPYYTEKEKLVLGMTDEITNISKEGLTDRTYQTALEVLGKEYVASVILAVACINAWNRIGRASLLIPN
jgi:AhpD family alkylhydroperoxidase